MDINLSHHFCMVKAVMKAGYRLVPAVPQVLLSQAERWRKQAVLLKLSQGARTRLEWFIWHQCHGENASLTARHFGITGKTFWKWHTRFDRKNLRTLEERSRAPQQVRQKEITPLEEGRIILLRQAHMRWGKMKLSVLYKNIYKAPLSSWKVQYTIKKHGLYFHPKRNAQTQAKRRHSTQKKRITELTKQPFPGFLIALDTIVLWINGQKRYVFTVIDTVSKIAFARMYTTKSSANAADFLNRFMYLLDHEVWNAGHDNGSEFHKHFQRAIEKQGINDWWSRTHTPKDNPVNERFNRTLQDEFIALGHLTADCERFNKEVTEWLIEYAFVRPHQSLGYQTPWEYYAKATKLLPMYSSCTRACRPLSLWYTTPLW
ncbi:MAG: integrase core domain-containing protein [Patescibacteria group bacterium]